MMRRDFTLLALLFGLLPLAGCGESGSTEPVPDMGLDGGDFGDSGTEMPGFDPDVLYEGEGTACRMTVSCVDGQVCAQAICVRAERLAGLTLTYGEALFLEDEERAGEAWLDSGTRIEERRFSPRPLVTPEPDGPGSRRVFVGSTRAGQGTVIDAVGYGSDSFFVDEVFVLSVLPLGEDRYLVSGYEASGLPRLYLTDDAGEISTETALDSSGLESEERYVRYLTSLTSTNDGLFGIVGIGDFVIGDEYRSNPWVPFARGGVTFEVATAGLSLATRGNVWRLFEFPITNSVSLPSREED